MSDIDENKLVVVQANRLVEASYQVSLRQKKLIQIMVGKIRKDDADFCEYIFRVSDLQRSLDIKGKGFYDELKAVTTGLIGRVIKIKCDDGREIQASWLASAEYLPIGTGGIDCSCVKLSFAPVLRPLLLQLKDFFSRYDFSQIAGMRSVYSIRLYEILNSRRKLGSTTIEFNELKRMFKVESKYKIARDFRIYVIEQAQKEINEKTDLAFDFVENRKSKSVVSITFHIRDNVPSNPTRHTVAKPALPKPSDKIDDAQPPLLPLTEAERETARLYQDAITEGIHNGVSESRMRDLLSTRNPVHVMENIEIARKRHMSAKDGEAVNLAGLTIAAITDDYAKEDREKRQRAAEKVAVRERGKRARELLETIETAGTVARRHDLNTRLDALPATERDRLRAAFGEDVETGKHGDHMASAFRSRGWKAAGMEATFRIFAAAQMGIGSEVEYQKAEAMRRGYEWEQLKADAAA